MLHAFIAFVAIEGSRIVHFGIKAADDGCALDPVIAYAVDLDAITSGEHQRLRASDFFAQGRCVLAVARITLTRFHIRGVMAEADAEKIHEARSLRDEGDSPENGHGRAESDDAKNRDVFGREPEKMTPFQNCAVKKPNRTAQIIFTRGKGSPVKNPLINPAV